MTTPHKATPEQVQAFQEMHSSICAAANALRSMAGALETRINEGNDYDVYRFEDLSGDIYAIRHALQGFERVVISCGLNADPIQWRV
jgi:hypothetical protein